MKKIQLIVVLMLSMAVSFSIPARTKVSGQGGVGNNSVIIEYGISGTINSFDPVQSIIRIDGVNYNLSGQGNLTNADLIPTLQIKYNREQATTEVMGRITRIWIEQNN